MAIHLNIAGTHGRSQEQQAEVREAKRILKERIRCDWEYGPLPQHRSSGIRPPVVDDSRPTTTTAASLVQDVREPIAGFRFHSTTTSVGGGGGDGEPSSPHPPGGVLGLTFDPTEWRDREYSSMSESSDEEEEVTAETVILESFRLSQRMELGRPSGGKTAGPKGKPFRFDGPDSVGAEVAARRQATKRRRQTRLAEESGWNDGLAHWLRRRDEWCGARDADAVLALQKRKAAAADADPDRPATSTSTSLADAESEGSTPRTSVSSSPNTPGSPSATTPEPSLSDVPPATVAPKGSSTTATTTTTTVTPTVSTGTSVPENAAVPAIPTSSQPPPPPNPQPSSSSSSSPPPPTPISSHPSSLLLPLAPPLLPASHPIRARITPQSYPEIYSKIILQARTPSVPINLRTLLAALVAGWKADDEWPPKPSAGLAAEKSLGRKKTAAAAVSNARPPASRRRGPAAPADREPEGLRHGVKAAVGRVLRLGGALSSSHSSSGGGVGGDAAAKNTSRRKEEGG